MKNKDESALQLQQSFEALGISKEMSVFLSEYGYKNKQELMQKRLSIRNNKSEQAQAINALIKYHVREQKAPFTVEEIAMAYKSELNHLSTNKNQDLAKKSEQTIVLIKRNLLAATQTNHALKGAHKIIPLGIQNNVDELIGSPNDIMAGIGELTESTTTLQRITHISDAAAAGLSKTADISSSLSGGLGLLTISYKCLKEKRAPNTFERAKMLHSAIILTLGLLTLTGVGGPVAISAFAATIIFLTFSKTVAEMFRDSFRLKSARIACEEALKNKEDLITQINQAITETQAINDALKAPQTPQDNAHLTDSLSSKIEQLNKLNQQLIDEEKALIRKHYKYEILHKRLENHLDKSKKALIITAGIISVIGAALTLTPLAPIGLIVLGLGASISLLTVIGFGIARFIENRKQKKQLESEKATTAEISNTTQIIPSDAFMIKELGGQAQTTTAEPCHLTEQEKTNITTHTAQDSNAIIHDDDNGPKTEENESVHLTVSPR